MDNSITINSSSRNDTIKLGQILGRIVQEGDVLLLSGPLGAGKTCLTQGIAQGLGISSVTQSPTFMLIREYNGRLPLYHMDLYRLEFNELEELGLDDYLYGYGVCVIEWAERGNAIMPENSIVIEISYINNDNRNITINGPKSFINAIEEAYKL